MPLLHKGIITISSLLIYWLIGDSDLELIFALALISIIGIPHGSTDHLLSKYIGNQHINKWPLWKFIIAYLSVMAIYGLLWYFFKELAFTIFMAISAYHFGEAQLIQSNKVLNKAPVIYSLWGVCVLMVLFLPHLQETKELIVPYLVSAKSFEFFQTYSIYFLGAVGLSLSILLIFSSPKIFIKELTEFALLYMLSNYTSLLVGFAVFFAFWHSFDSASFQLMKLKMITKGFNLKNWIKKAAPYTIISWVGIIIIILIALQLELSWPLITFFFVLVSLITLPHVIIMSRFYSDEKQ